ncbi:MAG: hypothetical protein IPL50_08610 [Chitinophagaceae bacterium]|nr:hypothetical protein [Chitinophagaceae bacterium]
MWTGKTIRWNWIGDPRHSIVPEYGSCIQQSVSNGNTNPQGNHKGCCCFSQVLARETFYDTFTGTCTPEDMQWFLDENYNEEKLSTEIQDEEMFCFFAVLDGEPVGYLQFKEDYKNFPEIKNGKHWS